MGQKRSTALEIKVRVIISSLAVAAMGVAILLAVLFSVPFPLVRKVWIEEMWGYYGLMNSICFFLIARGMWRMHASAPFAGLGILIHEQILTWRGFSYLQAHLMLNSQSVLFVGLSFLITGGLGFIFIRAICHIFAYRQFKHGHDKSHTTGSPSRDFGGVIFFSALLVLSWVAHDSVGSIMHFKVNVAYSCLRILGGFLFFATFLAIGYEVDLFFKQGRWNSAATLRLVGYGLMLVVVQFFIYSHMPIEAVILTF
ncbi:MAG: hypothetical protein EXS63_02660 [Candidatus Omnitrophica bacterium]|nr:hypothetical protein [Candidatus Omnitrophota bacterium]